MPREITKDENTMLFCSDILDSTGIPQRYWVKSKMDGRILNTIDFQDGAIQRAGVNGIQTEDLLFMCIDRLEYFQKGNFSCRENALALTKIQEALHWLEHRTADRKNRGVEGTEKV